ncbi:MAG: VOC family protein [Tagaea sp.]|nr:VOC family protein [Tagaea sp.]
MIVGHWHTSWTVEDIDRSLRFYCEGLGFELVHRQEQSKGYTDTLVGIQDAHLIAALLKFGGQPAPLSGHTIELIEYVRPKGVRLDTPPNNVGAAHIALIATDARAMHARMLGFGARFVSPPVAITGGINKGGYTCYMRDPDGFTIELMQPPEWRLRGEPHPKEI